MGRYLPSPLLTTVDAIYPLLRSPLCCYPSLYPLINSYYIFPSTRWTRHWVQPFLWGRYLPSPLGDTVYRIFPLFLIPRYWCPSAHITSPPSFILSLLDTGGQGFLRQKDLPCPLRTTVDGISKSRAFYTYNCCNYTLCNKHVC